MLNRKNSKAGQSLVEVVISLGILGVIFADIVVLVVYGFNLANASRKRTEAVVMAQEKMTESIIIIQHNCPINIDGADPSLAGEPGVYASNLTSLIKDKIGIPVDEPEKGFYTDIQIRKPTVAETDSNRLNREKFYFITIEIHWADKGIADDSIYRLDQLIRIN